MVHIRGLLLATSIIAFATNSYAQSGPSDTLCSVGADILMGQTLSLRQEGMPIDAAKQSLDSFWDQNPTFWSFMVKSVNAMYQDPTYMVGILQNGQWQTLCVQAVRGY